MVQKEEISSEQQCCGKTNKKSPACLCQRSKEKGQTNRKATVNQKVLMKAWIHLALYYWFSVGGGVQVGGGGVYSTACWRIHPQSLDLYLTSVSSQQPENLQQNFQYLRVDQYLWGIFFFFLFFNVLTSSVPATNKQTLLRLQRDWTIYVTYIQRNNRNLFFSFWIQIHSVCCCLDTEACLAIRLEHVCKTQGPWAECGPPYYFMWPARFYFLCLWFS